MILDNFSFINSDPLCEFAHDFCNCDDIVGNPFEYIIKSIYENQMIIEDMNMAIISEEYTYLRDYGTEPILVGEAGIIGTIFGGLFRLLGNAFKAICSFFKSIFSRNKSTVESASKEIKDSSDGSTQKLQDKPNKDTSGNSNPQPNSKEPNKIQTQKTTKQSASSQPNAKIKRDLPDIYRNFCDDAVKNPSKYGLDDDVVILGEDYVKQMITTFANEYANIITGVVNDMSSDIRDRYQTIITVYDHDLEGYDYFHNKADAKEYLKNHPGSIDSYLKASDKIATDKTILEYGDWFKNHIQEKMINQIPEFVRQSDIKEMYHEYVTSHNLRKMTEPAELKSILSGKSDCVKVLVTNNAGSRANEKGTIELNTAYLLKLNDQCAAIFNNAKTVIAKAEKDLKAIQQIAKGAEQRIQVLAHPGDFTNIGTIAGKKGNEAKSVMVKYFNSLGQSITYLISTATTTNAQTASAFAKLITHAITENTNSAKKLARFADKVYMDAFNEWMENGSPLVL